jgi:hypothetical protein
MSVINSIIIRFRECFICHYFMINQSRDQDHHLMVYFFIRLHLVNFLHSIFSYSYLIMEELYQINLLVEIVYPFIIIKYNFWRIKNVDANYTRLIHFSSSIYNSSY